jgi:hypothetical protein
MGVRTRGLDIAIGAKRQVADSAARAEAKAVIERCRRLAKDWELRKLYNLDKVPGRTQRSMCGSSCKTTFSKELWISR